MSDLVRVDGFYEYVRFDDVTTTSLITSFKVGGKLNDLKFSILVTFTETTLSDNIVITPGGTDNDLTLRLLDSQ